MTKFTDDTRTIILDAIGNHGLPITTACEAAGISPTTYQTWLRNGREQKKGQFVEFVRDIDEALAKFQQIHAQRVIDAATKGVTTLRHSVKQYADGSIVDETVETNQTDWRAAAWLLERRFPEWNQKLQTEQNVTVNQPVTKVVFEVVPIPPEMRELDDYAAG